MAEHTHAAVIRAIADKGFEAGEWQHDFGEWRQAHYFLNPLSHPQLKWRIKPEPKPDVVRYMNVYDDQSISDFFKDLDFAIGMRPVISTGVTMRITWHGDTGKVSAEVLP